jgi:hypothetical protein
VYCPFAFVVRERLTPVSAEVAVTCAPVEGGALGVGDPAGHDVGGAPDLAGGGRREGGARGERERGGEDRGGEDGAAAARGRAARPGAREGRGRHEVAVVPKGVCQPL